eukprot:746425-Hanusia_phi.AAC.2
MILTTKGSSATWGSGGVNLLEESSDKRYGHREDYREYHAIIDIWLIAGSRRLSSEECHKLLKSSSSSNGQCTARIASNKNFKSASRYSRQLNGGKLEESLASEQPQQPYQGHAVQR